jgi:molybdate transport system substrate-binding protein
MKHSIIFLLVLSLILTACNTQIGSQEPAAPEQNSSETTVKTELYVFAAASMTETMEKIAVEYQKVHPEIKIVYTFDSSGTLKTQIQNGAVCDLFISAAQKQMNQLEANNPANTENLDFVDPATRINLVENKVTLAVPQGNPSGVQTFTDLNTDKVKKIALGNSDVPVGQYSEELLTNLGIWDAIQPKVSFGSNVKEVTTWVSSGSVDCGIVYGTDAFSAGLEVVDKASPDMLKSAVVYPAAVLKTSTHQAEAKAFLDYLQGPEAKAIFESVGFAIPSK